MVGLARILHGFSHWTNRMAEIAVAVLATFFTGLLILSVFSRYLLRVSIVTSVEMVEISFCWSVFLAAACLVARDAQIKVDFFARLLPPRIGGLLRPFADCVVLAFGIAMASYGTELTTRMFVATFPTLQISLAWMYAALPVSGALIALHAADRLVSPSRRDSGREESAGVS